MNMKTTIAQMDDNIDQIAISGNNTDGNNKMVLSNKMDKIF